MREVYYDDWLSNPVMVKKHDGSWRMCVDFTDLNKACPQDCFPLPEIDWKVESLCGYPFKCFLDTYKGYHQIQMAELDEEKTAFHTSHGVYCYSKMPFGLKNAGATYQRLVDKAFNNQVGRNIEVYVDDLIIKSHTEIDMLRDMDETFRTFLSKSAEKSLPLFKTLKKCIKKSDSYWTPEAEQAFKQLKQHLSELPMLVAPKPKEELIVYMYAPHGAISVVLMTERGTFTASNNKAKYEALIVGLRITAQMGVRNVHVSVDSKLVVNQVPGTYVAKEENMIKYLEKAKSLSLDGSMIDTHSAQKASIWSSILKEVQLLKTNGFDFLSYCSKRIGDGISTRFWLDIWKGDKPLWDAFPRLFALESNCQISVAEKLTVPMDTSFRRPVRGGVEQQQFSDLSSIMDSVIISSSADRWVCSLSNDGNFSVKEVRNVIDEMSLPSHSESARWVKNIPIKINIFAWRARRDCLPTRNNLIRKGVSLESSSCLLCLSGEEDVHHVFFRCSLARDILRRVCQWWDIDWQSRSLFS
ncbi:reverse transcriptase domain-containing protein [Tanacetum coccineum]|uniref:Reverse transcriptase domain-containing protein n=1 Tax=Tanacetum coccineum TaxID=301880 RepID=A0ABQ5GVJ8_9ASTR